MTSYQMYIENTWTILVQMKKILRRIIMKNDLENLKLTRSIDGKRKILEKRNDLEMTLSKWMENNSDR